VTLGSVRNTEDSSNQGTGKRSRYRATWITSILVALAATATAALSTFARADTPRTAADITPNPSPITLRSQVTTHDPSGSFGIQAYGLTVHFYGTARDPDSTRSVKVVYYLNNKAREVAFAKLPKHHYSRYWRMSHAGTYRVKVAALNYGQGNARTVLGTRAVKLIDPATRNPRGNATFRRSGTTLRVLGPIYDPDNIRAGLNVRTYNNGHVIGATRSNGKTHRYEMRVRLRDGLNRVNVKAFNIGMGTRSAVIAGRAAYRLQPPWTSRYSGNQAIAAKMMASHGSPQMAPLVRLWNRESRWLTSAYNPSGTYGIPQALPGSKMGSAGPNWRTSATTQIRWGLRYIHDRYGSPGGAWAHELAQDWY
jgi:hypothetical protein